MSASLAPSVASTALSMCTSVVSPMSSAFLAAIANAVQQMLSVQQVASVPACSVPASVADSGGVPALPAPQASSSQLAAQASSFAASGAAFASSLVATVTPPASGRPNNRVVPTFVSTFSTQIPSLAHSTFPGSLHAALPSCTIGAPPLAPLPGLHPPFVVGPGFSPVPAKLVSQIAEKFVELHQLLPSNIVLTEPDPQFNRRLVRWAPCINVGAEEA